MASGRWKPVSSVQRRSVCRCMLIRHRLRRSACSTAPKDRSAISTNASCQVASVSPCWNRWSFAPRRALSMIIPVTWSLSRWEMEPAVYRTRTDTNPLCRLSPVLRRVRIPPGWVRCRAGRVRAGRIGEPVLAEGSSELTHRQHRRELGDPVIGPGGGLGNDGGHLVEGQFPARNMSMHCGNSSTRLAMATIPWAWAALIPVRQHRYCSMLCTPRIARTRGGRTVGGDVARRACWGFRCPAISSNSASSRWSRWSSSAARNP